MRRADEQKLEEILSESLERVEVPKLAWKDIAGRLAPERKLPRLRWWLSSAAVIVLLAAGAMMHRIGPVNQAAQPAIHTMEQSTNALLAPVNAMLQKNGCTLVVSISGPTVLSPRGTVTVRGAQQATGSVLRYNGETLLVSCGSKVTLFELPNDPAHYPFAGWSISGDAGKYESTVLRATQITLTVTGATQVNADYSGPVQQPAAKTGSPQ